VEGDMIDFPTRVRAVLLGSARFQVAAILLWALFVGGPSNWAAGDGLSRENPVVDLPLLPTKLQGRAMGMTWSAQVRFRGVSQAADSLQAEIQSELDRLNAIFSLYQEDSELSRWNRQSTTVWQDVSLDLARLVERSLQQARRSGGYFDPAIEPVTRAYELRSVHRTKGGPDERTAERLLEQIDWREVEVRIDPPALRKCRSDLQLDLNAIVEGLALERMHEICRRHEVEGALLDIGGEKLIDLSRLINRGKSEESPPLATIHIESPADPRRTVAILRASSGCVSTSGTYRQRWFDRQGQGAISHLIDPFTRTPLTWSPSLVSVYHADPIEADGWATTLMVAGREAGLRLAEEQGVAAMFYDSSLNPPIAISTSGREIFRDPQDTNLNREGSAPVSSLSLWRTFLILALVTMIVRSAWRAWRNSRSRSTSQR
jgi:thiamine biosynthesis lipoprotein